jgi:hypothetical protein
MMKRAPHPSTYDDQPSNSSVADAIRVVLDQAAYPAIRRLRWSFRDSELVVEGIVPSYYQKQIVCSLVTRIDGLRHVINRVEVAVEEVGSGIR